MKKLMEYKCKKVFDEFIELCMIIQYLNEVKDI